MNELLEHLDAQLASSRRLLGVVLAQGEAIRRQDVESVLARLRDIQAEIAERAKLERERDRLLGNAAAALGLAPDAVDLESLLAAEPADVAAQARTKSAELRGLVAEIGRVHTQNRVLIRQELAFVEHLMRALAGVPQGGYTPAGVGTHAPSLAAVDARA